MKIEISHETKLERNLSVIIILLSLRPYKRETIVT